MPCWCVMLSGEVKSPVVYESASLRMTDMAHGGFQII